MNKGNHAQNERFLVTCAIDIALGDLLALPQPYDNSVIVSIVWLVAFVCTYDFAIVGHAHSRATS